MNQEGGDKDIMPDEKNDKLRPKPETTSNKESLLKFLTKDNKSLRQSLALIGITTIVQMIVIRNLWDVNFFSYTNYFNVS